MDATVSMRGGAAAPAGRRHAWGWRLPVLAVLLPMLAGLAGCAAPPPAHPADPAPEAALAIAPPASPADSPLARIAAAAVPATPPGQPAVSGFRLLFSGESAFNLRLALVQRATRSIDVQLYALADDDTGRGFLRALRDAAERGVQVRLLLDDVHAPGNVLLAGLAAHPGASVRLFNPLPLRGAPIAWRLVGGMLNAVRLNRRMHNKLMVVDGVFAVTGGRNVADAYFMHDPEANFLDLDVLAAGPVVPEMSRVFARYWGCGCAVPIDAVAPVADAAAARERFAAAVRDGPSRLGERQRDTFGRASPVRQIAEGRLTLDAGVARVLADDPVGKLRGLPDEALDGTVTGQALALVSQAREEALVVSPYLIPGADGLATLRTLAQAQPPVQVTLLTNSVGAADEPLAYAAYERYRLDLLRAGVRIYELSPSLARDSGRVAYFGDTVGRLHAKALVIDRRRVVIGSMNLDPRSTHTNTEMALVIDSPVFARQLAGVFNRASASGAHLLRLAGDPPAIEWVADDGQGHVTVQRREPHGDFWQWLRMWLLRPWVSEELL